GAPGAGRAAAAASALGGARAGPRSCGHRGGAEPLVDSEVPDLDLGERPAPEAVAERGGAQPARRPRARPRAVFRQDAHLVLPRHLVMLGDELAAMGDVESPAPARDLDRLADEREGDRVAIRLEAHEVILGDAPRLARLEPEARLASRGDQLALRAGKAPGTPPPGECCGPSCDPAPTVWRSPTSTAAQRGTTDGLAASSPRGPFVPPRVV